MASSGRFRQGCPLLAVGLPSCRGSCSSGHDGRPVRIHHGPHRGPIGVHRRGGPPRRQRGGRRPVRVQHGRGGRPLGAEGRPAPARGGGAAAAEERPEVVRPDVERGGAGGQGGRGGAPPPLAVRPGALGRGGAVVGFGSHHKHTGVTYIGGTSCQKVGRWFSSRWVALRMATDKFWARTVLLAGFVLVAPACNTIPPCVKMSASSTILDLFWER
mmetsp:Transcript_24958/g.34539  ORF Transcript_24958/g.34539 Transcript_24958/m.34539 type:complete len:215 (-) Transcript_24958:147-791(-)